MLRHYIKEILTNDYIYIIWYLQIVRKSRHTSKDFIGRYLQTTYRTTTTIC